MVDDAKPGEHQEELSTTADDDESLNMYRKDALSVVNFKLVRNVAEYQNKNDYFKPDMAHQIFGDNELIFGYRFLNINIYYLHNSFQCFVDIHCSGEVCKNLYKPDDINEALEPWIPVGTVKSEEKFLRLLENEKHDVIFGTVLDETKQPVEIFNTTCTANYKFTVCDITDRNFKEFHERFQTLIIWFIDAATFIDLDDEQWMIFYIYEQVEHPITKEIFCSPIGFCTVYKFFSYPSNIRARISQFFVLPTHQRQGLGSKLYEVVMKELRSKTDIVDITVEQPTPLFQKIRDFDDSIQVLKLLKKCNIEVNSYNKKKICSKINSLKISNKQTKRLFDILHCFTANKISKASANRVLDEIKERITHEVERELKVPKRFCGQNRVSVDIVDKKTAVEVDITRYLEDIEPSIKCLETRLGDTWKN